jgi:hypothetical protein
MESSIFVENSVVKTCLSSLDQAGHLIAEVAIFNFHQEHQMRMTSDEDQ